METTSYFEVLLMVSLGGGLLACSAEDEPGPSQAEQQTEALADCSSELGSCYVGCQNVQPTPRAECFTDCERAFDRCLRVPLAEAPQEL